MEPKEEEKAKAEPKEEGSSGEDEPMPQALTEEKKNELEELMRQAEIDEAFFPMTEIMMDMQYRGIKEYDSFEFKNLPRFIMWNQDAQRTYTPSGMKPRDVRFLCPCGDRVLKRLENPCVKCHGITGFLVTPEEKDDSH